MQEEDVASVVERLLAGRRGHFRLESGHHGDLWLDLELLFHEPRRLGGLLDELAGQLSSYGAEAVCGPLIEGAFVSLEVALRLGVSFTYASPIDDGTRGGLFPVRYVIPKALRRAVEGKRIAIVNDVINAGSAVRGALDDLASCGARPVVIGTLAVLGDYAARFAADAGLPLETVARIPNEIWTPAACPLCRNGIPLDRDLPPPALPMG
jgi:orotate phosphoribosyltransferase